MLTLNGFGEYVKQTEEVHTQRSISQIRRGVIYKT